MEPSWILKLILEFCGTAFRSGLEQATGFYRNVDGFILKTLMLHRPEMVLTRGARRLIYELSVKRLKFERIESSGRFTSALTTLHSSSPFRPVSWPREF